MEMKSMAMTPEEQKEYGMGMPQAVASSPAPQYPYGLRICLNDETLQKLGLSERPKVGSFFKVMAMAEVCGTSERECENGEVQKNVDLQIVEMGLEKGSAAKDAPMDHEANLYGDA